MSTFLLVRFEVFTDRIQIIVETLRMSIPCSAHFFDDRIYHVSSPINSSGEHISGHANPLFSIICLTIIRVKGLLI